MLYLIFNLGDDGYAIAAHRVIEMLPFIAPKPVRGTPPIILGAIGYRGRSLPVVDLVKFETGRPAALRMGTRMVVVEIDVGGRPEQVGLILESATELLRCAADAFSPFAPSPRGQIQLLDLDALLPAAAFGAFFGEVEGAS